MLPVEDGHAFVLAVRDTVHDAVQEVNQQVREVTLKLGNRLHKVFRTSHLIDMLQHHLVDENNTVFHQRLLCQLDVLIS